MKKFLTLALVAGILSMTGLGCSKDTGKVTVKSTSTTEKMETKPKS